MCCPLVIVDGPLFMAVLDDHNEIVLSEIDYVPFSFEIGSGRYERQHLRPDIIRLDYLNEYLVMTNRRIDKLFGKIEAERKGHQETEYESKGI